MVCPKCGGKTRTLDTRDTSDGKRRRRKLCKACEYCFTTYELTAVDLAKQTSVKRESESVAN